MKLLFKNFLIFTLIFLVLSGMSVPHKTNTIKPNINSLNDFFLKRTLLYTDISELESMYKRKFTLLEKMEIRLAKRKIRKEFEKHNITDSCDKITFTNRESQDVIITQIENSNYKYKKCDDKYGPTYSVDKAYISSIVLSKASVLSQINKDQLSDGSTKNVRKHKHINRGFLGLGIFLGILLIFLGLIALFFILIVVGILDGIA